MAIAASIRLPAGPIILLLASNIVAVAALERTRQVETVVLLDFSSPLPNYFWQALETELESPETVQALGSKMVWMKREEFRKGMDFPEVLQVSVQGDCTSIEPGNDTASGPLGWVYLVSDQIQPFAFVDCRAIRHLLGPSIRHQTRQEQQDKMARAMARVIAHELTHILTQNRHHASWGLQKANLSRTELLRPDFP